MEIRLTFLTPAFLYGADQTKPEFRIASLIGQMRYWWRMTKDWSDVKRLRDEEAKIFGLGEAGAKPFYIWVVEQAMEEEQAKERNRKEKIPFDKGCLPQDYEIIKKQIPKLNFETDRYGNSSLIFDGFMSDNDFNILKTYFGQKNTSGIKRLYEKTHRYVFDNNRNSGLSYLFYPFNQDRKEPFSWLSEGSWVKLELEFVKDKEGAEREVLLSLFFLARFGGLGSRSRRGAGSIELDGCDIFKQTEQDLKIYINENSNKKSLPGHEYFSLIEQNSPIHKALLKASDYFKNSKEFNNWGEVLNHIGSAMRSYRTNQNLLNKTASCVDPTFIEEAKKLHKYFETSKDVPCMLTKDAFGLPRIINFTSSGFKKNALTITPFQDHNEMRRASPLYMTVNRKPPNKYYCSLLVLWEGLKFLPDKINIRIKKGNENDIDKYPMLSNPGPEKLVEFLQKRITR